MSGRLQQLAREVRKRAPRKRIYVWAPDWLRDLIGRRLVCWAPPKPDPTAAELQAATEAHLLAELQMLRKRAAERGITVPSPTTPSPAEGQAGDKENRREEAPRQG